MEKKEKLSFISPLPFNLTTQLSTMAMERRQRRKSVCSPVRNSRNDPAMYRPLTESSVLPRPQWYEELVQRRMRDAPIFYESKFEETNPSVENKMNQGFDVKLERTSPDILTLLDSNFTPKRFAKSGRRASVASDNNDVFSLSTPLLVAKQFDSFTVNSSQLCEILPASKRNVIPKNEKVKITEIHDSFGVLNEEVQTSDFIIPELPQGQVMIIELKSNWGDEDFIGLNGIEIFEVKNTNIVKIDKLMCETDTNCDIRVLFDGVYRTHDNAHIWITSFNALKPVKIRVQFCEKITLLLIRIWNYNKSRIYSDRGVKHMEISLDSNVVFNGEIAKACGELNGPPEKFGDTILFTTNETLLESLGKNDKRFKELLFEAAN